MPRTLTLPDGLRVAYLEAGRGPLALCLHGFPDTATTFRHLVPALTGAGYRVVAPYLRGYAPTGLSPTGDYALGRLVADAVALHEALGGDGDAILIGHDWGAEIAYGAAATAPERWRRLVTLAIPPLALDERLFSDFDQLRRFFYLYFLKSPGAPPVVAADGMAFLDRLWALWSPGYDAREDLAAVKAALSDPAHLDAAIAYYRAPEPGLAGDRAPELALTRTPPQPTLYLHGERDGCIGVDLVGDAAEHLPPGSRFAVVPGAGHFPQLEQPRLVADLVLDHLAR
jgi:pimeloyl-ACP methyl ester carboxylesterase